MSDESATDMEFEHGSEEEASPMNKSSEVTDSKHSKFLEIIKTFLTMHHKRNSTASAVAIKKYMGLFGVNVKENRIYINDCLKKAVIDGTLEQVSGKGASGSFKLPHSKAKKTRQNPSKKRKPDEDYYS